MRLQRPESNDLIIGMSLAELFLFMMLVTWWSSAAQKTPGVSPTIEIANLRSQVERLEAENGAMKTEVKDLHTRIEALLIALNLPPDTPLTPEGIKKAAQTVHRGSPVCNDQSNVLADVALLDGRLSVTLRGHPEVLSQGKSTWTPDQILAERPAIDQFLDAVLRYSLEHGCRFDYSLRYVTTDDYHQARTTFEKFLYPGPITREH